MTLTYIFLAVTLLAFLTALIAPWRYLRKHKTLLPSDIVLPFAPALFVLFGVALLNEAAQVGWGVILYPAIAILPGVLLLNVRAFLLTRLRVSPEKISPVLLTAVSVTAFLFGAMISPWYD
ncbi:hypothetical protein [Herbaspirillum sp. CAH-3]|uniref:hypothetical protein n=1 Tax=Herbaspirillum sp. CAH-3 TaxID=2605746 RepID=UPI0012ACC555|nr:hypothetical protein [Herbaspirillum sp. CAH-3]MRT29762.1 hypothetical protein [Herbaspirillum sp. CAH-3]